MIITQRLTLYNNFQLHADYKHCGVNGATDCSLLLLFSFLAASAALSVIVSVDEM